MPLLADLLRFGRLSAADAAAHLVRRHNLPHKTIALARLARAAELLGP